MPPVPVAFLVFDGFDLLDLGGPYEVLLTANRLAARRGEEPPFTVSSVAPDGRPVRAYGGLGIGPTSTPDDLPPYDLFVVPGLIDLEAALTDDRLIDTVRRLADRAEVATVSVCTGAFLLAAAGLLAGRTATTHHEDVPALDRHPDVGAAVTGCRWVDDGDIVTIGGLSSSIAGGLHLVDRFAGRDLAVLTARQIEHAWDPDGHDVVA